MFFVSHEVSAIAGHQQLGNLIVIWDDNQISIEDDTTIAKSEDVAARYAAYGWHTQHVDWRGDNGYHEDVDALYQALEAAKAETDRPSFIALRTIIGWPAPKKQNTGKIHGSALGADEVLDHHRQDVVAEVRRLTGKKGVDVVVEHVGEATWERSILALAHRGRLVTCGATTGPRGLTELRHLFPASEIRTERVAGLVKSIIAVRAG